MKTKQAVISPLPWKIATDEAVNYIADANGDECLRLFTMMSRRNMVDAHFIVRAVNSHEALLEALKKMVKANSADGRISENVRAQVWAKAQEAIANAEPKFNRRVK